MATVTSASNAPAPTPAQQCNCRRTRVLSPYVEDTPLPQTNPATLPARRRRSRLRRAELLSAGHRRQKRRSRHLAQAIETLPITATALPRCRRRPPSTAAKKYGHKLKQFLSRTVSRWWPDADAVIPDGTKCRSQDDDRSSHSVCYNARRRHRRRVTLPADPSVNADWGRNCRRTR